MRISEKFRDILTAEDCREMNLFQSYRYNREQNNALTLLLICVRMVLVQILKEV